MQAARADRERVGWVSVKWLKEQTGTRLQGHIYNPFATADLLLHITALQLLKVDPNRSAVDGCRCS